MFIALAMDYMTFIVTISNNRVIDRNDNAGCTILTPITLDDVLSICLTINDDDDDDVGPVIMALQWIA